MKKTTSGFTIVELLIVIVVIAILAAITIVAYNGIQTRAKNTKIIGAANVISKAINLYHVETDNWPTMDSCVGELSTYPDNGQCWNSTAYVVNSSFINLIKPYIGNMPVPDVTNIDTVNSPKRGILYDYNSSTDISLYIMLVGTSTTCPSSLSGVVYFTEGGTSAGRWCNYRFSTS